MASQIPVKIVYGAHSLNGKSKEEVQEILDILKKHHVVGIDTASSHVGFVFPNQGLTGILTSHSSQGRKLSSEIWASLSKSAFTLRRLLWLRRLCQSKAFSMEWKTV
jgi:hypothetical protein